MNWFTDLLKELEADLTPKYDTPVNAPVEPPQSPKTAPTTTQTPFTVFCSAIRQYEGANPANNNPYDFRYYPGGYLPKYGTVKESTGGFAMFETLALGELYGQTCITEMIQNHPTWTFLDFFERFAPPSDNNPTVAYATFVAKALNTSPETVISTLVKVA